MLLDGVETLGNQDTGFGIVSGAHEMLGGTFGKQSSLFKRHAEIFMADG